MQVPLMRGSSEATAATTKLAKSMLLVKRPRFCTRSSGVSPSCHCCDTDLARQHARIDAGVRQRFGQTERAAGNRRVRRPTSARWPSGTSPSAASVPKAMIGCSANPRATRQVAAPPSTQANSIGRQGGGQILGTGDAFHHTAGSAKIDETPASSSASSNCAFLGGPLVRVALALG